MQLTIEVALWNRNAEQGANFQIFVETDAIGECSIVTISDRPRSDDSRNVVDIPAEAVEALIAAMRAAQNHLAVYPKNVHVTASEVVL